MYDNPARHRPMDTDRFLTVRHPEQGVMQPKDRIAAWKRWEMASFAPEPGPRQPETAAPEPVPPPAAAASIDEAELDSLRLKAQVAGEKDGYQQGYVRGQAEGHAAAMAAVHEQARQLRELTLSLPAALRMAEGTVADELLALAMELARQMVGQALTVDPQSMLAVVRQLLRTEPALLGTPQLLLHPDDAALVAGHLSEDLQAAGWRIRSDTGITRGGCRVTASSGEHDATLETRWERVTATLAQHPPAPAIAE